ncbi:MAG: hypothetical protein WA964_08190 [Ilumatobacter sp.]|uniref:hypothetical protein n=1 Tax=Ilumatobacter sp. TaxID=1967498 RepID=UPI003C72D0C5
MFTTGTKFFIGASVMALIATLVYGLGQGGVLGTVGLASATAALMGLGTLNAILRDSNVFSDDEAPIESSSAAQFAPASSVWPLGFAFGAVIIAVGLISYQTIVVVGLVALVVTGGEWAVQAWAERASGNVEHNAAVRSRLSNPLEYPVGGAVAIGIIVFAFSRVMLWLSKTNTVIAFAVLAAVVLAVGFGIAFRPKLSIGAVGGVMAVGAVAVVAAGAAAGLDGERDIPEFETTAIWQEEALLHPEEYAEGAEEGEHPAGLICESPEEFPEADEDVSQTVAAKSGSYQVFLTEEGTLAFDVPGPIEDGPAGMVIPRSNPTNVIFRNESDEHRRLSIDFGTQTIEIEDEEVVVRDQICTTLIEPGGAQLLTVEADQPTFAVDGQINPNGPGGEAGDGYWFFVPGVDTAKLELIVP